MHFGLICLLVQELMLIVNLRYVQFKKKLSQAYLCIHANKIIDQSPIYYNRHTDSGANEWDNVCGRNITKPEK